MTKNKPILFLLVGIPASGKSTYARKITKITPNSIWVSRDNIRNSLLTDKDKFFDKETQVFNNYINQINNLLNKGYTVFADATHVNKASRLKVLTRINTPCTKVAIVFDRQLQLCLSRNAKREGTARVPDVAIHNMANKFTIPTKSEGFFKIFMLNEDGSLTEVEE